MTIVAGFSQDAIDVSLERIHREYLALRKQPDVGRLVLLDGELRRLFPTWYWEGPWVDSSRLRPGYDALGIRTSLFEAAFLGYSGKLLREAHRLDPKAYRSHTLYSTVFSADGEAGDEIPSPTAAEAYLKEFPSGPFVVQTHLALAHFYADLFKVIRSEETRLGRTYKYDCFQKYISSAPLAEQRTRAQQRGVAHYVAVDRLHPKVESLARELTEMREGRSDGWHYCAD